MPTSWHIQLCRINTIRIKKTQKIRIGLLDRLCSFLLTLSWLIHPIITKTAHQLNMCLMRENLTIWLTNTPISSYLTRIIPQLPWHLIVEVQSGSTLGSLLALWMYSLNTQNKTKLHYFNARSIWTKLLLYFSILDVKINVMMDGTAIKQLASLSITLGLSFVPATHIAFCQTQIHMIWMRRHWMTWQTNMATKTYYSIGRPIVEEQSYSTFG